MIRPRPLPIDAYFDERPVQLDNATRDLAFALGGFGITRVQEWITRGKGGPRQRGLRSDIVTLCVCPQMLPCKRPTAGWCAREHGVSRQYAYRLQQEFSRELADYIRFRGQRFRMRRAGVKSNAPAFASRILEMVRPATTSAQQLVTDAVCE